MKIITSWRNIMHFGRLLWGDMCISSWAYDCVWHISIPMHAYTVYVLLMHLINNMWRHWLTVLHDKTASITSRKHVTLNIVLYMSWRTNRENNPLLCLPIFKSPKCRLQSDYLALACLLSLSCVQVNWDFSNDRSPLPSCVSYK